MTRFAPGAAGFAAGVVLSLIGGLYDVALNGSQLSLASGSQTLLLWLVLGLFPSLGGAVAVEIATWLLGGRFGAARVTSFALAGGVASVAVLGLAGGMLGPVASASLVLVSCAICAVAPNEDWLGGLPRRAAVACVLLLVGSTALVLALRDGGELARGVGFVVTISVSLFLAGRPVSNLHTGSRFAAVVSLGAIWTAFTGASALVPHPTASAAARPFDRPHVVLIVLDTQRADHLGAYGHTGGLSPAFDALAEEGVLYENCFASASWTVPTHASLFTGLYPPSHGASFEHHRWLDGRFRTVAEALADSGYRTVSFSSNKHLAASNLLQGFATIQSPGEAYRDLAVRRPLQLLGGPAAWMDNGAADAVALIANYFSEEAVEGPQFLFVNLLEPHWRYLPPLADRLALASQAIDPLSASLISARFYGPLAMAGKTIAGPVREAIGSLYAAEVRYQDRQLGRLLDLLDRSLDLDRTLVVITADHGENLGEAGRWGHVFAVNDHLIHVPMLVRYPPLVPANLRSSGLCQLIDVPATIADVVGGVTLDASNRGRTLVPARFRSRPFVFVAGDPYLGHLERMSAHTGFRHDVARFSGSFRGVRNERYKYLLSTRSAPALYDLERDPDEIHNLIEEHPELAARLQGQLNATLSSLPRYATTSAPVHGLSEEEQKQLEGLGYVEIRKDD